MVQPLNDEEVAEINQLLDKGDRCTPEESRRKTHLIAKYNLSVALNDLVDVFYEKRNLVATRW